MEKEFVSYEQALELKELGFDEECLARQDFPIEQNGYFLIGHSSDDEFLLKQSQFHALIPLYQQAFRWFREKYNLTYHIVEKQKDLGKFYGGGIIKDGETFGKSFGSNFKTYEEAELACLKQLIKIVKDGK